MKKVKLVLENGMEFSADSFGADIKYSQISEIIFTTSMTGYQEVITDPSYYKQMVVMTYPLVGNYGINAFDFESSKPYLSALIVNEYCEDYSHFQANKSLAQYLKENNVLGITNIDTRNLTNIIRNSGSLKAKIIPFDRESGNTVEQIKLWHYKDHVKDVSVKDSYIVPGEGYKIALVDCGCKKHIIQKLSQRNCEITVVPYDIEYEKIKALSPDGIMFSNGPGDPKDVPQTIELFKKLNGKYPIFGICLGHQIFALSQGIKTEKMKFGHHSSNHPVKDIYNDNIYITTQNHGYAVVDKDLEENGVELTHYSLNDKSVEGIKSIKYDTFTVQFHPEGNQGPEHDKLFDQFIDAIKRSKNAQK